MNFRKEVRMKIMKRIIIAGLILAGVILCSAAVLGLSRRDPHKGRAPAAAEKVTYRCPMHPSYTSDRPGDCPICGMKLVKAASAPAGAASTPAKKMPAAAEEKGLDEICITHQCTMKDCPMMVKANVKPGERIFCPVCGEAIVTTSGKAVEIAPANEPAPQAKKERKLLYYRNPMNPQATSPVPMKDAMGMDYVPVYEEEAPAAAPGAPVVTITPERRQLIGVKTEAVKMMNLTKVVRASGKIAYDPELAVTQEEFIQALRAQDHVKNSPLADVISRAAALSDAARGKLRLLGMSDDRIAALEKTRRADTGLYLPGKGEHVWAYLSVYEYEIGLVTSGAMVEIEAVAYPGEKFLGPVVSVNPVLDPVTRTNHVRVEVANPQDKLKPEMFVNGSIEVDLGEKKAVPESAVWDTGVRKIVYLSREDNILESREVRLGQKAQGYYEVLDGLSPGDVVVTSGNFLVDAESKLQAPAREEEHHGQ